MSRWNYLEINAWMVRGVIYHDWNLALAAAQRQGAEPEQLYRKVENPAFWDKQESESD